MKLSIWGLTVIDAGGPDLRFCKQLLLLLLLQESGGWCLCRLVTMSEAMKVRFMKEISCRKLDLMRKLQSQRWELTDVL